VERKFGIGKRDHQKPMDNTFIVMGLIKSLVANGIKLQMRQEKEKKRKRIERTGSKKWKD
jgi:hypothetical protein